jgi:hypothetical protein
MVAPERSVDLNGVSSDAVKIAYKLISVCRRLDKREQQHRGAHSWWRTLGTKSRFLE